MIPWLDPQPVDIPGALLDLNLPAFIAQTLVRRGITDTGSAQAFLHPDSVPLKSFPEIGNEVENILSVARAGQPICVWGDFDVDGQTSTTLLVQMLRAIGANTTYYIPIRGKESHGVHIESLKPIVDNGAKLVITCDTGITAYEAIDYANSRGVDVIVTDHHDMGDKLPNAKGILNPKLLPKDHPLANLAGVGVAYKLAQAIFETSNSTIELLDLVALGLIADVALLKGETRTLAQRGIKALRDTNRIGLKILAELSGTDLETSTEETIGFSIAPRLNALGRLGDANPIVELLTTENSIRARILAAQIEGLNTQRRLLTHQVYQAAEAQLQENPKLLTEAAIILAHHDWPGGVVGIVANKLVERYHKPAILLTEADDGILRGSARSVEGLNITEAIAANKEVLITFGGHPMAAGLSLQVDKFNSFRRGLNRAIEKQLGEMVAEEPSLQIDAWLKSSEINLQLAESLESLAPFGAGNPELTFATRNLTLKSIKELGKTREHRRITVSDENGHNQDLIWWNGADEEIPEVNTRIDIAYSLRANTYRGEKQLTLRFQEMRVVEEKPIEVWKPNIQIRDLRNQATTATTVPSTMIWAEGADKSKGVNRFDLHPADEFVIYTSPPSPAELRTALKVVGPKIIYLIGSSPTVEKVDVFLSRLAGMAKFAINQRKGKVSVREFSAATAQREETIRLAVEWLAAGGHIHVEEKNNELVLATGDGTANQYLQQELYTAVKDLLEETAAYRRYFSNANADALFKT